jgi:hypothetical protein
MGIESEPKKFQPRMVASFSKTQLMSVATWFNENAQDFIQGKSTFTEASNNALKTVQIDEKGKVMNEEARKRLGYGIKVLGMLLVEETYFDFTEIQGRVQVWQTTPDENKLEIRYNTIQRRNFGQRRY